MPNTFRQKMPQKLKSRFRALVLFCITLSLLVSLISAGFVNLRQWLIIVFATVYGTNVILSLIMLTEKRDIETNFSWLIIFNILPLLGQILYLLIGQKYFYITKFKRRWREISKTHQYKNDQLDETEIEKNKFISFEALRRLKANSQINHQNLSKAKITVIGNGHEYYKSLFRDLREAKKFIHITIYIINPGELWEECRQILLEKAREGVEVRFIVDYFGTLNLKKRDIKELRQNGVEFKFFSKISWFFLNSQIIYRNHKKCFIIDGKIVYTGGLNVGDEYVNISRHYGIWLDASIKIEGEYVAQLANSFIDFWYFQTKQLLDKKKYAPLIKTKKTNAIAQLIETGPDAEEKLLKLSFLSLIGQSNKEILIATPYFIPTVALQETLKAALLRGVKIKIFFSGYYDWKLVWLSSLQHLFYLEKFGLQIHFVRNCWVHSKIALFDQEIAYVGTLNFDHRSFYLQFEMANFFIGEPIKDVKELFEQYKKWSLKKNLREYKKIKNSKNLSFFKKIITALMKPYF